MDSGVPEWRDFVASFMETFLPRGEREKKAREVEQSKQVEMSKMEYRNKFLRLSKYALHLMANLHLREWRFAYVLRFGINW